MDFQLYWRADFPHGSYIEIAVEDIVEYQAEVVLVGGYQGLVMEVPYAELLVRRLYGYGADLEIHTPRHRFTTNARSRPRGCCPHCGRYRCHDHTQPQYVLDELKALEW